MPPVNLTAGESSNVDFDGHTRTRWAIEVVAGHRRYTAAQLRELEHPPEPESPASVLLEQSRYQGWAPGTSDYDEEVSVMRNFAEALERAPYRSHSPTRLPGSENSSLGHIRMPALAPQSSSERSQSENREFDDPLDMSESSRRTTSILQSLHRGSPFFSRAISHLQNYPAEGDSSSAEDGYSDMPRLIEASSASPIPQSNRLPQLQHQAHTNRPHQTMQQQMASQYQQHQQIVRQEQQLRQQQQMATQSQQHQQIVRQEQQLRQQQRQHRHAQHRESQASNREYNPAPTETHLRHEALNIRPSRPSDRPYRQSMFMEPPSTNPPIASRSLDDTIQYLERLRFCESREESLSSAKASGFEHEELIDNSDFVLDTSAIEPPPESSWLKIGGVLSGSQHAAGGSLPPYLPNSFAPNGHTSQSVRLSQHSTRNVTSPSPGSTRTEQSSRAPHTTSDGDEEWPVKVTIHSIDYSSMTLSGTMEAFNVPDKSSPTQESSITTFLEGEIIDFNTHTLETKTFNASPRVDGTYWRKLEPFKKLTDNEIVGSLVSKKWFAEELCKNWILMRWKGTLHAALSFPFSICRR